MLEPVVDLWTGIAKFPKVEIRTHVGVLPGLNSIYTNIGMFTPVSRVMGAVLCILAATRVPAALPPGTTAEREPSHTPARP